MNTDRNIWEWDSLESQRQAPRWLEVAVVVVGIPVVLFSTYYIISPAFDDEGVMVVVALIILFGIAIAVMSAGIDARGVKKVNIRADDETITCRFKNQSRAFRLKKLDWSRVRITSDTPMALVLAEGGANDESRFPLFGMSKRNRRELWKIVTRYRDSNVGNSETESNYANSLPPEVGRTFSERVIDYPESSSWRRDGWRRFLRFVRKREFRWLPWLVRLLFATTLYAGGTFLLLSHQGAVEQVREISSYTPAIVAGLVSSLITAHYKLDRFLEDLQFVLLLVVVILVTDTMI